MDKDIREDLEFSIKFYEDDIEILKKIERIHRAHPDTGCGLLGINCDHDYLRSLYDNDRKHFEHRRSAEIAECRRKIEQAKKHAREQQHRRNIDKAQSKEYDRWLNNH